MTRRRDSDATRCWRRPRLCHRSARGRLFRPTGSRSRSSAAVHSLFMAQSYAAPALRAQGAAARMRFPPPSIPAGRDYPYVLAMCRSGTTSEVGEPPAAAPRDDRLLVIAGVAGTPATVAARRALVPRLRRRGVGRADPRFATTTLALLRASLGEDVARAGRRCRARPGRAASAEPAHVEQVSFLGTGWTYRPAERGRPQAARGGPVLGRVVSGHGVPPRSDQRRGAVSGPSGPSALPPGLADQITATGRLVVAHRHLDPLAALVLAQRSAVERPSPTRPRSR